MKKLLLFVIAVMVIGCKHFETQKLSSDQIYQEELEHLDWTNLDSYPSFAACEDYSEKSARKKCFETRVAQHIFSVLAKHQVVLKDSVNEKIALMITITDQGHPVLDTVMMSARLEQMIPGLKTWLNQAVHSLPQIYPGEKRGVPVDSQFKLPLVIASH